MAVGDITFNSDISRTICLMTGQTSNTGAPTLSTEGVPARDDRNTANTVEGAFYTIDTPEVSTLTIDTTAGSGTMVGTFTLWGYLAASATWYPILVNGGVALAETSADHIAYTEEVSVGRFDRLFLQLASVGGTATAFEAFLTTARRDDKNGLLRAEVATHESRLTTDEARLTALEACTAGSMYITTPAATTIAVAGTYVKAAGTTTLVANHQASMPADNRLRYDGTPTKHMHLVCNLSVKCSANNQVVSFAVAKNGVIVDHSIMEHFIATGADIKIMAIHADMNMSTNDYVELFVTNETSTASVTVQRGYMFFMGMLCLE